MSDTLVRAAEPDPQSVQPLVAVEGVTSYAIVTTDMERVVQTWNQGARRLYGYDGAEVTGRMSSLSMWDPADVEAGRAEAAFAAAAADGTWEGEVRRLRKDGSSFFADVSISLRHDADGAPTGFVVISRDLTETRLAVQELRKQQTYNRGLIESNIDALMTTDPIGIITDVNRQMCEVTGCGRDELIGTPFKDYFTDAQRAEDGIRRVLSEDRVTNYELTIRGRDGREVVVSYNATTFRGADGRLRGVFAAARDITDQKRLEEQLRRKNEELEEQNRRVQEANRLKSEFLANMSHELRTPLNGIIGFADLMVKEKVGPVSEEHREYLGDILTSARHLLQLINDVLDLSKVESGKMEFHPETLDLVRIISEVRDVLRTLVAAKRIRVTTEVESDVGEVFADPARFKQVLYNYLSNALKFTPEDGHVTVRVTPEGEDQMRIEVSDTGIGIAAQDIGKLFAEFQQLDASVAKRYQGTGLGLALTRRIVEAQGGRVGVESEPGRGSTFWAVLPRKARTSTGNGHTRAAGDGPCVLIIEDGGNDRSWLCNTLSAAGYAVEAVATGADGVACTESRRYDAITLDLLLPDISGWDVVGAIREGALNRETPIVVVSVLADRSGEEKYPVAGFLLKPVEAADLLMALRNAGLAAEAT